MEREQVQQLLDDRQLALEEVFGERSVRLLEYSSHIRIKSLVTGAQIRQRAQSLDNFFKSGRWKIAPQLIFREPGDVLASADYLDSNFKLGDWKKNDPGIAGFSVEALEAKTKALEQIFGADNVSWQRQNRRAYYLSVVKLERNARFLDETFGERWKRTPVVITLSPEKIVERMAKLNEVLGDDWKKNPMLLFARPENLERNSAYLDKVMGGRSWIKHKHLNSTSYMNRSQEELERTVDALNEVFAGDVWKKDVSLLVYHAEKLREYAGLLTEAFSDKWRSVPEIMTTVRSVLKNLPQIDEIFGNRDWRSNPRLAMSSPQTVAKYSKDHTLNFGSKRWMRIPTLASVTPSTFNDCLSTMRRVVGRQEIDPVYLVSTMKTKNTKVKLIRELLGHNFIKFSDRVLNPDAEVPSMFELSGADRIKEAREVRETLELLRKNPRLLLCSENEIRRRLK